MSQHPYAGLGADSLELAPPPRTSAMAIISLVIGIISIFPLLCIFPGSGTLAMVFGGAAVLLIHRERGRLGGTGLAATGIVLGLLVTVVQVTVAIGISNFMGLYKTHAVGPVDEAIRAMKSRDYATARKLFTPEADAKLTDAMMDEFTAAYEQTAGVYQGFPDSLLGVVKDWYAAARAMSQLKQGGSNIFPFVADFGKGPAVVIVVFDQQRAQQGGGGANSTFPTINLGVLTVDGKQTWLNDNMPTPGNMQFKLHKPGASPSTPTEDDATPEQETPATDTPPSD